MIRMKKRGKRDMKKGIRLLALWIVFMMTTTTVYATKQENELTVIKKEERREYKNNQGDIRLYLNYQYPLLEGPQKGIPQINEETKKQKEAWFDSHKELINSIKGEQNYGFKNVDEVSYIITYNKDGKVGVLYEGYLFTGGAHGMPYRSSYIYELDTGEKLAPSQMLQKSNEEIKNSLVEQFRKRVEENKDWYWPEALQIVKDMDLSKIGYYITDEGIVFYFDPYVLAPFAAGFVEVLVPWK